MNILVLYPAGSNMILARREVKIDSDIWHFCTVSNHSLCGYSLDRIILMDVRVEEIPSELYVCLKTDGIIQMIET
jgi:hypothetical protein